MDRAFSTVTIKNISEDRREFEGWASTPTRDRQNDELMPEGARFELPLPFLLDHDHEKVVGEVYRAEVSKAGIKFWARIKKIAEPGAAKDLVDYAWALIKNKLRPVVSVGFRPLTYEHIEGAGLRFLTWEWYELSGVGVAAQPEAKITATKGARSPVVRIGMSKKPLPVVKLWNGGRPPKVSPNSKRKPSEIRIIKTRPRVVKLSPEGRALAGLDKPRKPLPVVKLTDADRERARRRLNTRVVKLSR